jgi:cell division septation protein DedD
VRIAPAKLAALPAPTTVPAAAVIPPPVAGSFSIVIGTYDNMKDVERAEALLKAQKQTPYEIDIVMAPNDVQRRVLLGRFPTREEADAALAKLGALFSTARVIPGAQERVRVLIP